MPEPRLLREAAVGAAGAAWQTAGATSVLVLSGHWAMAQPTPRAADLASGGSGSGPIAFDARALGPWDSSLLLFLLGLQQACAQQQRAWDPTGLPPQVPRLLALAQAGSAMAPPPPPAQLTAVARLGASAIAWWDELVAGIRFAGEVSLALSGLITRRVHMRWREFGVALQMNTSGALPIVTLIALLVGVIIAFLGVVVLKRFGAGYYVSYLSGFGMLREMGALMTGIIMAGRTGAAYAAELGSMKLNEELDAYTTVQ